MVADTSGATKSLEPRWRADGVQYYQLEFSVVLLLGLTELKAQICWKENVSGHFPTSWFGYLKKSLPIRVKKWGKIQRLICASSCWMLVGVRLKSSTMRLERARHWSIQGGNEGESTIYISCCTIIRRLSPHANNLFCRKRMFSIVSTINIDRLPLVSSNAAKVLAAAGILRRCMNRRTLFQLKEAIITFELLS